MPHERAINSTAPSSSSEEKEPISRSSFFSSLSDGGDAGKSRWSGLLGEYNRLDCHVMQLPDKRLSDVRIAVPRLLFLGFASAGNSQYCCSSSTSFRFATLVDTGGETWESEPPLAADLRPAFLKRMPHALHKDCKTTHDMISLDHPLPLHQTESQEVLTLVLKMRKMRGCLFKMVTLGPPGPFLHRGVLEVPQCAHTREKLSPSCIHCSTLDATLASTTALDGR